jgi:diguanylate cyclase (GGDEF)-like protein
MTSNAKTQSNIAMAMRMIDHLDLPLALVERDGDLIHANTAFKRKNEAGTVRAAYVRLALSDDVIMLVPPDAGRQTQSEERTGLRNRSQMLGALKEFLDTPKEWSRCSLMLIEIDRFHSINEIFGHRICDALIHEIGARLKKACPEAAILGHTTEERFGVFLPQDDRLASTRMLAEELLELLSQPYRLEEHIVGVGLFIGFAGGIADDTDVHDLVERCYIALAHARSLGSGSIVAYSTAVAQKVQSHRSLEIDFRKAVEQSEIEPHFQPIIDAHTRKIVGFEALARWHHPQRGLLMPDLFIPLAEKAGLISRLSHAIIEKACRAAHSWPKNLFLSLNLSALLFDDINIVDAIRDEVERAGFDASRIELEITESVFLSDERLVDVLKSFQAIGMRVVIDDFGTGFSSLSYLRALPFDKIKIDKSFISEMMISPDSRAIVKAITMLAHELGMAIVAEGVENEHQVELLRSFACDQLQGYLFSKPLPAAALEPLLKTSAGHG